jgi:carboxyl-terminal processing protease
MNSFRKILAVALVFAGSVSQAASISCAALPDLFRAYLSSHYSAPTLSDDIKTRTADYYIKVIDPSKTIFLESDADSLRKNLVGIFTTMKTGNCAALDEVRNVTLKRLEESEKFARSLLGPNYKLDESVEIATDPKKRGYAKTADERNTLLAKYLHFQIANYLMSDMKLEEAKTQLVHRYELAVKRVREKKSDDLLDELSSAFANALDPHSDFFSKDRLEEFRIEMSLSLEGIGASLSSQDGYTTVEEIIPGGAADRSKMLRTKDKIIAVAQDGKQAISTIDMDLKDVVKMIRGPKGTKVTLTILRQGTERVETTIVRDKIDMKEQEAKLHFETRKLANGKAFKTAVIDLPSFYGEGERGQRSCYEDVKKLVIQSRKAKADGIVLNLSRNGGGLLDDAVKMAGLFIGSGGIVATQSTNRRLEILADEDESVVWNGPLVVLISRVSASASEIVAGAMKDYQRAVIVGGDHTFGKGTVQAVVPLPRNLGAIKVTTGMFFVPGGKSTQHEGVPSDVPLPSVFNDDDIGEKSLDYSLIPKTISPFVSDKANSAAPGEHWDAVKSAEVALLAKNSKDRVAKNPKFAEIQKEIEDSKKNKGIIKLAEVLKKSRQDKNKKKAEEKKSAAQRVKDMEKPYVDEAIAVLGDLIELRQGAGSAQASSR